MALVDVYGNLSNFIFSTISSNMSSASNKGYGANPSAANTKASNAYSGGIALDRYIAEDDDAPEPTAVHHNVTLNRKQPQGVAAQTANAANNAAANAAATLERSKAVQKKQQEGHTVTISLLKPIDNYMLNDNNSATNESKDTHASGQEIGNAGSGNEEPASKKSERRKGATKTEDSGITEEDKIVTVKRPSISAIKSTGDGKSKVTGDRSGVYYKTEKPEANKKAQKSIK